MEKPWKVIMAFVGVFIAGSVFGGLLALRLTKQRDQQPRLAQVPVSLPPPVTVTQTVQPQPAPTPSPTQPPSAQPARPNVPVPQVQLPPGMAVQAPQLMRRYVERLDLTPEQKERVNPLLQRAAADIRRQQQTNLRETGIIIQHLQEDLAKELTPAQRGRLEEMAEHQRQIIEQREHEQRERAQQEKQYAQQEKQRMQQATKPPAKDAPKAKPPQGKPPEDGE